MVGDAFGVIRMIHLVLREPISYQVTLGRTLHDFYEGKVIAWFLDRTGESLPIQTVADLPFAHHYLRETGYRKLFQALRADAEAVVILGGWSSPMTIRTLLVSRLLRRRIFIW